MPKNLPLPPVVVPAPDLRALASPNLQQGLRDALAPLREWFQAVNRWATKVDTALRAITNDPVNVAGLEGRYYIRAALDPTCDPSQLVRSIMTGEADDTALLTRENRALVAAAAVRGAAARWDDPTRAVVVWHRQLGEVPFQVAVS